MKRVILHLDMDAFFAAVEQLDNPELRGKPLVVGGSPDGRGVVATCSYEARRFGVRSAMPLSEAKRRCPECIFVRGRMSRYSEISRAVFAIMADYSPQMERVSIDEAFLDVTKSEPLFGPGEKIARTIQQRIMEELSLSASVGVAPNKFVAKVASDLRKPQGLVVVAPEEVASFLAPLSIERIWGVGPKTAEMLHALGLHTIGDVQKCNAKLLAGRLGVYGERLHDLSLGLDERPVAEDDDVKSVGHEHTFDQDVANIEILRGVLLHLASKVGRRMRRGHVKGKTVTLKLRYMDFSTFTRQAPLSGTTDLDLDIYHAGDKLLTRLFDGKPVRLIGVSVSSLMPAGENTEQLDLFHPDTGKSRRLIETMDRIRNKHGDKSISYAKENEFPPE
ncbi:MAG TPA: DNA polymerase IV [Bacillota bacterium]|nr:DNA polymerase IV [Bacillota bacterium]